jgi:hypothetical protein
VTKYYVINQLYGTIIMLTQAIEYSPYQFCSMVTLAQREMMGNLYNSITFSKTRDDSCDTEKDFCAQQQEAGPQKNTVYQRTKHGDPH